MQLKHTLLAIAIALPLPAAASAQACFGVPTTTKAAYAAVGLPEHGKHLHVGGAAALSGALSAGAEFTHTRISGGARVNAIEGTLANSLALGENAGPLTICPLVTAGYRSLEGNGLFSIGAGAGVTAALQISDGAYTLHPYLAPRVVHHRADGESDTEFGFALGANLAFGNYYAGAQFSRIGKNDSFALTDVLHGAGFRIQGGLSF